MKFLTTNTSYSKATKNKTDKAGQGQVRQGIDVLLIYFRKSNVYW